MGQAFENFKTYDTNIKEFINGKVIRDPNKTYIVFSYIRSNQSSQVEIKVNADCTVDWGDGTIEHFKTAGSKFHSYSVPSDVSRTKPKEYVFSADNLDYMTGSSGPVPHQYEMIAELYMPDTITEIKGAIYISREYGRKLVLSKNLKTVPNGAFVSLKSPLLQELTIPQFLNPVPERAFSECDNLRKVTFLGRPKILKSAFNRCVKLTDITLDTYQLDKAQYAFQNCISLENLTCFPVISYENSNAIAERCFESCKNLKNVTLQQVGSLGAGCFNYCTNLFSIEIDGGYVKELNSCFWYCENLTFVKITGNTVPNLINDPFRDCKKLLRIIVPQSMLPSYKRSTGWKKYEHLLVGNTDSNSLPLPSPEIDVRGAIKADHKTEDFTGETRVGEDGFLYNRETLKHTDKVPAADVFDFDKNHIYDNDGKLSYVTRSVKRKESIETLEDVPLDDISVSAVGNKIYLFGGYKSPNLYDTISMFDTSTKTYSTLPVVLPKQIRLMSSCAVGTNIYLFGGTGSDPVSTKSSEIYKFDTLTQNISLLSAKLPAAEYGFSTCAVGKDIYLFKKEAIWKFNTQTDSIEILSAQTPKYYTIPPNSTVSVGTDIYCIGLNDGDFNKQILKFDTLTNTIDFIQTEFPVYIKHCSLVAVGKYIYVLGGDIKYSYEGSAQTSTAVYLFDTETNQIKKLKDVVLSKASIKWRTLLCEDSIYTMGSPLTRTSFCFKYLIADYSIKEIGGGNGGDSLGVIIEPVVDIVKKIDVQNILNNYAHYDGQVIEFVANGDAPNKTVGYGYVVSDPQNNQYLVENTSGITKKWNKTDYEVWQVAYRKNVGLVDCDSLTIDVQGDPPMIISGLENAINKPPNTGAYGYMKVISYNISNQLQTYTDVDSGKSYTRNVKGTAGAHSFGTWQEFGGGGGGGATIDDKELVKAEAPDSTITQDSSYIRYNNNELYVKNKLNPPSEKVVIVPDNEYPNLFVVRAPKKGGTGGNQYIVVWTKSNSPFYNNSEYSSSECKFVILSSSKWTYFEDNAEKLLLALENNTLSYTTYAGGGAEPVVSDYPYISCSYYGTNTSTNSLSLPNGNGTEKVPHTVENKYRMKMSSYTAQNKFVTALQYQYDKIAKNSDLVNKQDKVDPALETTDKTIVGSINEVNAKASGGGGTQIAGGYKLKITSSFGDVDCLVLGKLVKINPANEPHYTQYIGKYGFIKINETMHDCTAEFENVSMIVIKDISLVESVTLQSLYLYDGTEMTSEGILSNKNKMMYLTNDCVLTYTD